MPSKITNYGSEVRLGNLLPPNGRTPVRVGTMLYPYHFKGVETRVENAALCISIMTDTDRGEGYSALMTKCDVKALIEILTSHLPNMVEEPT